MLIKLGEEQGKAASGRECQQEHESRETLPMALRQSLCVPPTSRGVRVGLFSSVLINLPDPSKRAPRVRLDH